MNAVNGEPGGLVQEKKKILLVALNAKFSHTNPAIRYLRASCAQAGVETPQLLELTINNYVPEILGRIYELQPQIIGFSCYIWNIELLKAILPLVRKVLPDAWLICGGPEVSYATDSFLRDVPAVDFVIRGEGEQAFSSLAAGLSCHRDKADLAGLHLAGVAYLDNSGVYVDGGAVALPALDNQLLPFPYTADELDELSERILYYETSRGCPFSCAYCLSCATSGVRYRPWEQVQQELQTFVGHNVRQLKLVDRTFNASKKHFWPILQFIHALPPDCRTNFHFEIAVDYLDEETIALLQDMPPQRVQLEIGIQTTNPAVLVNIQRVNHWKKIAGNIRQLLQRHNMHLHTDLIIGLPGENLASFANSFNMVYALDTDMLQLGFLKFLKGAAMLELVEKYHYQYMDCAPYEVLANNCLSFQEIHWLHIFEDVFELYHNAGRCRSTCNYLIAGREQGDAFSFYAKLTDFWQKHSYHHLPHQPKQLYGLLLEFIHEVYSQAEGETIDCLLRFDALRAEAGKVRPAELHWTTGQYQDQWIDFWFGRGTCQAGDFLPEYNFKGWRELRRCYHLERFKLPVHKLPADLLQSDVKELTAWQQNRQNVWLLFSFSETGTHWQEITLPEMFEVT